MELLREERQWERFRIQWADFRNTNRGKDDPEVKPTDLIRLSFDKDEPAEDRPIEEVEAEAIERFKKAKEQMGSKIKKADGK